MINNYIEFKLITITKLLIHVQESLFIYYLKKV